MDNRIREYAYTPSFKEANVLKKGTSIKIKKYQMQKHIN